MFIFTDNKSVKSEDKTKLVYSAHHKFHRLENTFPDGLAKCHVSLKSNLLTQELNLPFKHRNIHMIT